MEFEYAANDFVLEWIEPGKRFLDIACGSGALLKFAESKGCRVTGIDIKPRSKGIIRHDLNKKLPFKSSEFDIVSCIDSMEHVENVSSAFREAARVLKSGGIFILTVPNSRWYKKPNHVSFFSYNYMLQLVRFAGLIIEQEKHYIEIPKIKRRIVLGQIPEICFHFVFKLRKTG